MEILRKEYEINGNKLLIELPSNLKNQKVEVIINPIHNLKKKGDMTGYAKLQKLLLNGPVITEEEEERFRNIDKEFEQWEKNLFA